MQYHVLTPFLAPLPKEGLQSLCIQTPALHFNHGSITITHHILYLFMCLLWLPPQNNINSVKKGILAVLVLSPTPRMVPDT